jgi:hypothetical protein
LIVFELRLGEQKRRVFYAEIYPRGVLDFSQSGKPCPGGIAVEQGGNAWRSPESDPE